MGQSPIFWHTRQRTQINFVLAANIHLEIKVNYIKRNERRDHLVWEVALLRESVPVGGLEGIEVFGGGEELEGRTDICCPIGVGPVTHRGSRAGRCAVRKCLLRVLCV